MSASNHGALPGVEEQFELLQSDFGRLLSEVDTLRNRNLQLQSQIEEDGSAASSSDIASELLRSDIAFLTNRLKQSETNTEMLLDTEAKLRNELAELRGVHERLNQQFAEAEGQLKQERELVGNAQAEAKAMRGIVDEATDKLVHTVRARLEALALISELRAENERLVQSIENEKAAEQQSRTNLLQAQSEVFELGERLKGVVGEAGMLRSRCVELETSERTLRERTKRLEDEGDVLRARRVELEVSERALREAAKRLEDEGNIVRTRCVELEASERTLREGAKRLEGEGDVLRARCVELETSERTLRERTKRLEDEGDVLRARCVELEASERTHREQTKRLEDEGDVLRARCVELEASERALRERTKRLEDEDNVVHTRCVELEASERALREAAKRLADEGDVLRTRCVELEASERTLREGAKWLEDEGNVLRVRCVELEASERALAERVRQLDEEASGLRAQCSNLEADCKREEEERAILEHSRNELSAAVEEKKVAIEQLQSAILAERAGQAQALTTTSANIIAGVEAPLANYSSTMRQAIEESYQRHTEASRIFLERLNAGLLSKFQMISTEVNTLRRLRDGELRRWSTAEFPRLLYLDLLEQAITGYIYDDPPMDPWSNGYDQDKRVRGWDWPSHAHTMIGRARLRNIRELAEYVIAKNIKGDFLEAGVWRGGACIFMRGLLAAYQITDRSVWVADSFAGLPEPEIDRYPADVGDPHSTYEELIVSLEQVRHNFERYNLLDEQVKFLPGWFKDTLPKAPIDRLSILRLDGDMYGSTYDTLDALYPKVSRGGFVIVDDYILRRCKEAVHDFRAQHDIKEPLREVDGAAVYWQVIDSASAGRRRRKKLSAKKSDL